MSETQKTLSETIVEFFNSKSALIGPGSLMASGTFAHQQFVDSTATLAQSLTSTGAAVACVEVAVLLILCPLVTAGRYAWTGDAKVCPKSFGQTFNMSNLVQTTAAPVLTGASLINAIAPAVA